MQIHDTSSAEKPFHNKRKEWESQHIVTKKELPQIEPEIESLEHVEIKVTCIISVPNQNLFLRQLSKSHALV